MAGTHTFVMSVLCSWFYFWPLFLFYSAGSISSVSWLVCPSGKFEIGRLRGGRNEVQLLLPYMFALGEATAVAASPFCLQFLPDKPIVVPVGYSAPGPWCSRFFLFFPS